MVKPQKSRNHHWWPVALQKEWTDRSGDIHWINPSGEVTARRAANRKVAKKSHGHTVLLNGPWTTNFEDDFAAADNSIPGVLSKLERMPALGGKNVREFFSLLALVRKPNRSLRDMCSFYQMEPSDTASLARLVISLLIRLPACRSALEKTPQLLGLPPDENIGKMNMRQFYGVAQRTLERTAPSSLFFVLIRAPLSSFVYGDGVLDWFTGSLAGNGFRGRALVPITPRLCIYVSTPTIRLGGHNCASFYAAPWMVDKINEFTQIYSKDHIFFRSKNPPRLTEHFKSGEFLVHERQHDSFITMLDEIPAGPRWSQLPQIARV